MSMSGIKVNDDVKIFFGDTFKQKKMHAYFTCVIEKVGAVEEIRMEDPTNIAPLPPNCTQEQNKEVFETMKATLKDEQPKFILFDFRFKTKDGRPVDKIALITWISDGAPIKIKMKYGATKEALKLEGTKRIHTSDLDDLDFNQIIAELQKGK